MRALLIIATLLTCGLLLALWFSHRSTPKPVAPDAASTPAEAATDLTRDDVLSPTADAHESARATPQAAHTSADLATTKDPECRVFGRVIDEHGASIADAKVSLYPIGGRWSETVKVGLVGPEGRQHEGFVVQTNAEGSFRFETPLPTADWIEIAIEADVHHANADRDFGPAGGRNKPRLLEGDNDLGDFRLDPCGAVRGRVLSAAGRPIPETWVDVPNANSAGRQINVKADERGEFLIGHVSAGSHSVTAQATGWITSEDTQIEIIGLETITVPDIVLSPAFVVSGTVVDEKGQPAVQVSVRGTGHNKHRFNSRTNDAGEFALYFDAEGTCALEVRESPGFGPWGGGTDASFETGTKNVRIVLRRKDVFTFHVVDARTREPIERFGLRVDPAPVRGSYSTAVEANIPLADHPHGDVQIPIGAYVVAWAPDHAPIETDVVPDAGDPHMQTLALRGPSGIRGRLVLLDKPLSKATLTLQREGIDEKRTFAFEPGISSTAVHHDVGAWSGRKRDVASSDDGGFAFKDLAPGTYALQIDGPGVARKEFRGLEVPRESTLQLGDVVLDAGATIRGVIVAEAGGSPQGFTVDLGRSFARHVVIDNVDGKFEFTGLEAGEHVLTWSRSTQKAWGDDDPHAQTITLAPGEVREVIIDASASAPCTLIVHVNRGGHPARGVGVGVRILSRVKAGNWIGWPLGKCDDTGTVTGQVDGDLTLVLEATTESGDPLVDLVRDLQTAPGGRIERTFEIVLGKLTVELPAAMELPDKGLMRVALESPGRETRFATATTAAAPGSYHGNMDWNGRTIAFGEFGPGTYDATVTVQRFEPDAQSPNGMKPVNLREPYKTKVVIEADHEAKILVP